MTRQEIHFDVPGIPRPQGSKRGFVNRKTGGVILTESGGQAHKDWRAVVALAGREAWGEDVPLIGPVVVSLHFRLPRPKSHPKTKQTWPSTRPDIDKLARSVLDALTHICWTDDGQIVELNLRKVWAEPDMNFPVGMTVHVHEEYA